MLYLYYIKYYRTPLHYAVLNDQTAIAQLLLQVGADKEAKDKVSTY